MGKPGPARDEDVHAAVVVVVGLVADQPAELVGHAGRLGPVLEGAIPLVAVDAMRLGRVERGDGQVEQAVVVEVLHDRAAGLVEAVDPHQVPDVAELADVELGVAEAIQRDQEPRIDLVGIFAQGHVGQVEQPADLEVVGELARGTR